MIRVQIGNDAGLHTLNLHDLSANIAAPEPSPRTAAADQIAAIKKQLADLQKAVEGLEASLQAESTTKPQAPAEPK